MGTEEGGKLYQSNIHSVSITTAASTLHVRSRKVNLSRADFMFDSSIFLGRLLRQNRDHARSSVRSPERQVFGPTGSHRRFDVKNIPLFCIVFSSTSRCCYSRENVQFSAYQNLSNFF